MSQHEDHFNNTPIETQPVPKNVGHLQKEPTVIICPACKTEGLSTMHKEVVTCIQKTVALINFCTCCCTPIKWEGRHDFNHYCSNCGCFIGRCIELSWYKRNLFKMRRAGIEEEVKWRNFMRARGSDKADVDEDKERPKKEISNID